MSAVGSLLSYVFLSTASLCYDFGDEIIIALFLTDAETFTLPKQLYDELRYQMKPTIAAASTFVIGISLVLLMAVAIIQRNVEKRNKAMRLKM